MFFKINENIIETNADGFLTEPNQWESAVAVVIAENDGVILTDSHWEILLFLRSYYEENQISPPDIRTLSKVLKHALGEDKGSKEQLSILFSEPLLETACRYAGLPKPIKGGCG